MQKWDYYTKFNPQGWPGCCGRTQLMRGYVSLRSGFNSACLLGMVKILPREPSAAQPGSPYPASWLTLSGTDCPGPPGLVFLDGARWGSNLQGPCLLAKGRNCPWPEALSTSADLSSCLLTLALRQSVTGSSLLCVSFSIKCLFKYKQYFKHWGTGREGCVWKWWRTSPHFAFVGLIYQRESNRKLNYTNLDLLTEWEPRWEGRGVLGAAILKAFLIGGLVMGEGQCLSLLLMLW